MIWGAITEAEQREVKQARSRKNLVFVKQVQPALQVLQRLAAGTHLQATFHPETREPGLVIQTDASPWGFGGILWQGGRPACVVGTGYTRRRSLPAPGRKGQPSLADRMGVRLHYSEYSCVPGVDARKRSGAADGQHRRPGDNHSAKVKQARYGCFGG